MESEAPEDLGNAAFQPRASSSGNNAHCTAIAGAPSNPVTSPPLAPLVDTCTSAAASVPVQPAAGPASSAPEPSVPDVIAAHPRCAVPQSHETSGSHAAASAKRPRAPLKAIAVMCSPPSTEHIAAKRLRSQGGRNPHARASGKREFSDDELPSAGGPRPGNADSDGEEVCGEAGRPRHCGALDGSQQQGVTVYGVFHPERYLSGEDCIDYQGNFITRSKFEKLGGSLMAKWYRSIRVVSTDEPLGAWLARRGLPVVKGNPRTRRGARGKKAQGSGEDEEEDEQEYEQECRKRQAPARPSRQQRRRRRRAASPDDPSPDDPSPDPGAAVAGDSPTCSPTSTAQPAGRATGNVEGGGGGGATAAAAADCVERLPAPADRPQPSVPLCKSTTDGPATGEHQRHHRDCAVSAFGGAGSAAVAAQARAPGPPPLPPPPPCGGSGFGDRSGAAPAESAPWRGSALVAMGEELAGMGRAPSSVQNRDPLAPARSGQLPSWPELQPSASTPRPQELLGPGAAAWKSPPSLDRGARNPGLLPLDRQLHEAAQQRVQQHQQQRMTAWRCAGNDLTAPGDPLSSFGTKSAGADAAARSTRSDGAPSMGLGGSMSLVGTSSSWRAWGSRVSNALALGGALNGSALLLSGAGQPGGPTPSLRLRATDSMPADLPLVRLLPGHKRSGEEGQGLQAGLAGSSQLGRNVDGALAAGGDSDPLVQLLRRPTGAAPRALGGAKPGGEAGSSLLQTPQIRHLPLGSTSFQQLSSRPLNRIEAVKQALMGAPMAGAAGLPGVCTASGWGPESGSVLRCRSGGVAGVGGWSQLTPALEALQQQQQQQQPHQAGSRRFAAGFEERMAKLLAPKGSASVDGALQHTQVSSSPWLSTDRMRSLGGGGGNGWTGTFI